MFKVMIAQPSYIRKEILLKLYLLSKIAMQSTNMYSPKIQNSMKTNINKYFFLLKGFLNI